MLPVKWTNRLPNRWVSVFCNYQTQSSLRWGLSISFSFDTLQGIPYIQNVSGTSVAFQLDVFEVRKISEIFGSQWSSEPCKILQVTIRIKTVYSYQSIRSASRNEDQNFWLMRGRRGKRVLVIPKQDFFAVRWNMSTGSSNLFLKLKGV